MATSCSCFAGLRSLLSPSPADATWRSGSARAVVSHGARRRVSDAYEVREVLGAGAFGTASLAVGRGCGRKCVLKVVDRQSVRNCEALDREVALHSGLDHPHIVRIYESFVCEARMNIAMELCQGGELCSALEAVDKVSEPDAKIIFGQIMHAVRYLHGQAVVHRDLKLENFLLQKRNVPIAENIVKLIDFGFATHFTPGARSLKTICGSPGYSAPEVWSGRAYDERCDIFSCGIVLYCLLTGRFPFDGETASTVIRNSGRQSLLFQEDEHDSLSTSSRRLIAQMCMKLPSVRLSAKDVLSAEFFQDSLHEATSAQTVNPRDIVRQLSGFGKLDALLRASLYRVAYNLDDSCVEEMRQAFKHLDVDEDGKITLDELHEVCEDYGDFDHLEALFRQADSDGSGTVEYTEFLAAMLNHRQELPEAACRAAFQSLDLDHCGRISVENLREALARDVCHDDCECQHTLERLFMKADADGDGELCYDEFIAMLKPKEHTSLKAISGGA